MTEGMAINVDDGRFAQALGASFVVHVVLLVAGGILVTNSPPAPISQGFIVELLDYEEPVPTKVEAPQESAVSPEGTIAVPEHRPMPKTKPRPTPSRAKPKPKSTEKRPDPKPATTATAPPDATPGGGGHIETEVPFPFDYYTETVTRLIMAQWVPTIGVGEGTKNVVRFDIFRDGSVSGLGVSTASGAALFDASTLAAVRAVGKFPPLPQGFSATRIRINFHFEYGREQ